MRKLVYLLLLVPSLALAQVSLTINGMSVPNGSVAITIGSPTATSTIAPTPIATPTSSTIIGPTPVPPVLSQFYTTLGSDGKVHAFPYSVAWNVQLGVVGIAGMNVSIDGVIQSGNGKYTYTFPSGNLFGYFFWQNAIGVHEFVLSFYDANNNIVAIIPEQITVLP